MIRFVGRMQCRRKREERHGSSGGENQLPPKAGPSCLLPSHSSVPTLLRSGKWPNQRDVPRVGFRE
jgi:hypothetical protein